MNETLTEQDVRHAGALAARQPRRDERVDLAELVGDQLRAAGDDEHDARRDGFAHPVDDRPVGRLQGQRLLLQLRRRAEPALRSTHVAVALGIRRLADHDDANVLPSHGRRRVGAERDRRVRRHLLDPFEDRGARDDVAGHSLPLDRPAAGLVADVVGVAAGDVDVGVGGERQHVAVVLQQHLRLGDGLPGERTVLCAADLVQVVRRGERVLEQPELELGLQDAPDGVVDAVLADATCLDLGEQQLHELLRGDWAP